MSSAIKKNNRFSLKLLCVMYSVLGLTLATMLYIKIGQYNQQIQAEQPLSAMSCGYEDNSIDLEATLLLAQESNEMFYNNSEYKKF